MIKIMLVDDEPIEREAIQLILERNRTGIKIAAEAKNGKEAVEQAIEQEPDIIFMDIKMPEVDGLQAVEQILAKLPDVKCIMVSAYDTFQYAKRAMQFGIKEYLLKPNKPSEVLEAFDRMVEELTDQKYWNQRLEQANAIIETEFILTLMMDHVHALDSASLGEWLEIDDTSMFVVVFSFHSVDTSLTREQKKHWYQLLKNVLVELPYPHVIGPLLGYQVPVLVNGEQVNNRSFIVEAVHHLSSSFEKEQLQIGVGRHKDDLSKFSSSYEEAILALQYAKDNPSSSYTIFEEKMATAVPQQSDIDLEKKLLHAIRIGDERQANEWFDQYVELVQKQANYRIDLISRTIQDFFKVLQQTFQKIGISIPSVIDLATLDNIILIKEAARQQLAQVMENLSEWRSFSIEGVLHQAKEYIQLHYNKQLTLEEVADEIGLSSYYFSRLFKEQAGISFIEYLTSLRMEKAKEWLLDPRYSLKEIALTVGYKDPNYFSRVFKKTTQYSPSDYRKQYFSG
ncbi:MULTISPECIES: response regulator transcription factor [Gracilibacillus]|uniref:response regulator transcription factor n=1 Tax=Gracilibacillus TaxID=74385 RepID=UPI00082563B6|nr:MULTISPECIES: response regulator transcription factor [Gracilibacillus]